MGITLLEDEQVEMYVDMLKEGTPFDRFVSHGHQKDPLELDIEQPRRQVERIVNRALRSTIGDSTARLIPIVGKAGTGKTHYYWVLKDRETKTEEGKVWKVFYIPSPPAMVRTLQHIYTCLVDEIGIDVIKEVSEKVVKKYQKRGLISGSGMKETIEIAARDNPGAAADVVRALITVKMSERKNKKLIAEKWLLAEPLSEEDISLLQVSSIIEEDDTCLAAIKIFAKFMDEVLVFYFDEMEIPYRTFGEEAEINLLETIKRIFNEVPNACIITACIDTVWDRIYNDSPEKAALADAALKGRMENVAELMPFTVEDIERFYTNAMKYYWEIEMNVEPPEDPLFPLDNNVFNKIYEKSHGNPRDSIKIIRDYLDQVLYDEGGPDITAQEIIETEKIVETVQPPEPKLEEITNPPEVQESETSEPIEQQDPIIEASPAENSDSVTEGTQAERIKKTLVKIAIEEDDYVIEVTPQSVAAAAVESIELLAGDKGIKKTLGYDFTSKNKSRTISAKVELEEKKYGIDVCSCKSFDRSGGVAAYYSITRLKDGLIENEFDKTILIVPKGTGGAKYTSVRDSNINEIMVVEIDQKDAEALILGTNKKEPSEMSKLIASAIFPELKPEDPAPIQDGVLNGE
ncbi:MAG: hypothetical protein EAX96_19045 [Candidatus Lokiarchaeota archaeon]|nr:hypothetical protein [Candidatus Lokiarchaeota archaeon]